jgi:hypothetical protein
MSVCTNAVQVNITTEPLLYCASFPSYMGEDSTLPLPANKANQKISQLFVFKFCHLFHVCTVRVVNMY